MSSNPSYQRLQEGGLANSRVTHSSKNSNRPEKKSALGQGQHRSRFFITAQEEKPNEEQRVNHLGETITSNQNKQEFEPLIKGYFFVNDKRVKGILGRLDSTVQKLNSAWESCERSIARSSSTPFVKPQKPSTTFALTEATMASSYHMPATSTKSGVQNFMSMTMSEFLSPDVTAKISHIAQSLDLDPRSNKINDYLWGKVNEGRDYYNLLADEIRKKEENLVKLRERLANYEFLLNNVDLEERIVTLKQQIEKVYQDIEADEMQSEVLHNMIAVKKEDRDLHQKRFKLKFGPYVQVEKELNKNVDEILTIEKIFENYMIEMDELKMTTKNNTKLTKKLKVFKRERQHKDFCFENNIDMEAVYRKKRKTFIIKTKKEIEKERQKEKERELMVQRKKLSSLFDRKKEFEKNFGLLSTVSKQYENKEEYVKHLDNLRNNNEELENRVKELSEEINLKRKIDLPTLQAELNELKTVKGSTGDFFEESRLKKELIEKVKRNEHMEESLASKQKLNMNLMRGVLTIFNDVTAVKEYLNLSKLDEVKLKRNNLGDVLLFCGEVLEILSKNQKEPGEIRSQPMSLMSFSDDD